MLRCPDVDVNEQVASAVSVEFGKTFASEFYYFSALCSCRYFHFCCSVDDWHFYCSSECCLREADEEVIYEVVAVAFKIFA